MTLTIILEALYNEDHIAVVRMINNAHPVKSYLFKNKLFVIHSGFRFMLYTGDSYDILIDLSDLISPQLLLNPISKKSSFPQILGLVLFKKFNYIDAFSKVLIAGISEDSLKIYPVEVKIKDIINLKLEHSEFYIFKFFDNSIINRFPLSKTFEPMLMQMDNKFYQVPNVC